METIRVLKWEVPNIAEPFSVPGRRVVFFSPQRNMLYVWTECVDDSVEDIKLNLIVMPTGYPLGENPAAHLMSCQDNENYVWHLYQGN